MKIHGTSGFKDPARDLAYFQDWVGLERQNQTPYSNKFSQPVSRFERFAH